MLIISKGLTKKTKEEDEKDRESKKTTNLGLQNKDDKKNVYKGK